ncbi:GNAT family N-acetyltransferase [Streptomyces sp. SID12501]|uniref:GNAT family N-acetyltransferase n=1 Tax=Streptomyces sp. SID12501 TaxID=2706042 RepID=UPI001EF241B3|nr:GNAT family N-acetyltransferase [Streptomyces sp. SID12501]
MTDVLTLSTYQQDHLPRIRQTLLDVYAEVYAKEIAADPFFSVERFDERLTGHASAPGWTCVLGEVNGDPVGYAYGATVRRGGWWNGVQTPMDPELIREDGSRTFGLFEIMVRVPWRGQGIARGIHDELMSRRPEERAALTVERSHFKVRVLYASWGYRKVGELKPAADSPLYDAMILDLR